MESITITPRKESLTRAKDLLQELEEIIQQVQQKQDREMVKKSSTVDDGVPPTPPATPPPSKPYVSVTEAEAVEVEETENVTVKETENVTVEEPIVVATPTTADLPAFEFLTQDPTEESNKRRQEKREKRKFRQRKHVLFQESNIPKQETPSVQTSDGATIKLHLQTRTVTLKIPATLSLQECRLFMVLASSLCQIYNTQNGNKPSTTNVQGSVRTSVRFRCCSPQGTDCQRIGGPRDLQDILKRYMAHEAFPCHLYLDERSLPSLIVTC